MVRKATIIQKLKNRVRRWLGLSDMFMGVDVGIKDESCIVIVSRLKGGQVRIIDCRLGNYVEIQRLVKELQARYGIYNRNVIVDRPLGYPPLI